MDLLAQPALSLDGGIPRLVQLAHHWPAASEVRRWAADGNF